LDTELRRIPGRKDPALAAKYHASLGGDEWVPEFDEKTTSSKSSADDPKVPGPHG